MINKQQFNNDLEKGKRGEQVVLKTLVALGKNSGFEFQYVGDIPECRYLGDIKVTTPDGAVKYIEVKNDSRIHETYNVLCEEYVDYRDGRGEQKGNMFCSGDYFAVVSEPSQKIYIIDYKKLREIYKQGEYRVFDWGTQVTYGYLVGTHVLRHNNALLGIIEYDEDGAYYFKTRSLEEVRKIRLLCDLLLDNPEQIKVEKDLKVKAAQFKKGAAAQ